MTPNCWEALLNVGVGFYWKHRREWETIEKHSFQPWHNSPLFCIFSMQEHGNYFLSQLAWAIKCFRVKWRDAIRILKLMKLISFKLSQYIMVTPQNCLPFFAILGKHPRCSRKKLDAFSRSWNCKKPGAQNALHNFSVRWMKLLWLEGNLSPGRPSSPVWSSEILLAPYRQWISRSRFLLILCLLQPHSSLCDTCITKETMATSGLLLSIVTAQKREE